MYVSTFTIKNCVLACTNVWSGANLDVFRADSLPENHFHLSLQAFKIGRVPISFKTQ
jgi:hypothetical protein